MRRSGPKRRGINASPFTVSDWREELGFAPGAAVVPRTIALAEALRARFDAAAVAGGLARGDVVDENGVPLSGETRVVPGQRVYIFRPVPDEPAEPIMLDVLARGDGWMAIDKPHGLATIPRGNHVARSVTVAARRQFHNDEIQAAHRLDVLTAGALLLVTRPAMRGALQRLFQERRVDKCYEALARLPEHGWEALAGGVVLDLKMTKRAGSLRATVEPGVANSRTRIRLVEVRGHTGRFEVVPETGRTHQIRLAMAYMGLPIVGDPLYGGRSDVTGGAETGVMGGAAADAGSKDPPPGRDIAGECPLQLVARSMGFAQPGDGRRIRIESRMRLDWEAGRGAV
ncbi:pseudouridine synthase [Neoactinobaculum massilliense]|uniref:pseudouridine synthase n=1 Tax=Neoactinobaculum massilliense TaxID=2364794 RepID=UPI000F53330B|nr:pseudouridine synthase [Neoactinobaculum massilliense]